MIILIFSYLSVCIEWFAIAFYSIKPAAECEANLINYSISKRKC